MANKKHGLLRRLADGLRKAEVVSENDGYLIIKVGDGFPTKFTMEQWGAVASGEECGFAGCAVGHAPAILGEDCPFELSDLDKWGDMRWAIHENRPELMKYLDAYDYLSSPSVFDIEYSQCVSAFSPHSYECKPTPAEAAARIYKILGEEVRDEAG